MRTLTREDILNADDLKRVRVEVPEWGGQLWIRTLTAAEREQFERKFLNGGTPKNVKSELAAVSVVDEGGQPIFSREDIDRLAEKASPAIERIFSAGLQLNGFTKSDVDELEGN